MGCGLEGLKVAPVGCCCCSRVILLVGWVVVRVSAVGCP